MINDPSVSSSSSTSANGDAGNTSLVLSPIPHNPPIRSASFAHSDDAFCRHKADRIRQLEQELADSEVRRVALSQSSAAILPQPPQPSYISNQQLFNADALSALFEGFAITMSKLFDSKLAPFMDNQRAKDATGTPSSIPSHGDGELKSSGMTVSEVATLAN